MTQGSIEPSRGPEEPEGPTTAKRLGEPPGESAHSSRPSGRVHRLVRRLLESPRGQVLLVWLSFLEAVIIPVPLEAVLLPYMQLRRDILWRIAALALAGFMAASLLGYAIGALAFNTLGLFLLEFFGWQAAFESLRTLFQQYGFCALLAIGLLPIPTQVAMLAGGAFGYPLPLFVLAMSLSRAVRYFGLALLVAWFGNAAEHQVARAAHWARRHRPTALALALLVVAALIYLWWPDGG